MTDKAKILVVEDEPNVLDVLLRMIARLGYLCDGAESGDKALEMYSNEKYDVILADIKMPGLNGIELAERIKKQDANMPIIIITGAMEIELVIAALRVGALDYILKPVDSATLEKSVHRAVKNGREIRLRIEQEKEEQELSDTSKFIATSMVFVEAIESRSEFFSNHSKRTAELCMKMCKSMGMPQKEWQKIYIGALLHDLGSMTVEDIIKKPEELNDAEKEAVQRHAAASAEIIAKLERDKEIAKIIRHHHERYDGTGYPDHLKGEEIPFGSRILTVADAYVAMISKRPFRPAITHEEALEELRLNAGHQFDPKIVEGFERIVQAPD